MPLNDAFEKILQTDEDLKVYSGKMFMVQDVSHRLQAWLPIINRDHTDDQTWHYVVENIILDVKGDIATMLAVLHELIGNFYLFILFSFFKLIFLLYIYLHGLSLVVLFCQEESKIPYFYKSCS